MTKEEYKELNIYLNRIYRYLYQQDRIMLLNINAIDNLCGEILIGLHDMEIYDERVENELTYAQVMKVSRDIIESINPKYLDKFDNLISSGILDFSYHNEYSTSECVHYYDSDIKLININREFNFSDVVSVVHEFFHYLNSVIDNDEGNRYLLTEFISIYFETYAINYLKSKDISNEEIGSNDRIYNLRDNIMEYMIYSSVLLGFESFGNINDHTVELINQYFYPISKDDFDNDCHNVLNTLKGEETEYYCKLKANEKINYNHLDYHLSSFFSYNYRYIVGTALAFYCIGEIDINKIIDLNDHINDKYKDFEIISLIKHLGIRLDSSFYEKVINNMKNFIEENNKVR